MITAGEYFGGDVEKLARQIYDRMDWPWFRDPNNNQFYMAWKPETGFSPGTWNNYAEQLDMYVLAAGSPTHPVSGDMFYSFKRGVSAYKNGKPFIYSWFGSLFTYQYAHAWDDFRNKVDRKGVDWFQNSVIASKASRQYSIDHAGQYKTFGPNSWGLTASKGPNGYKGYGAPPSGEPGVNNQNYTVVRLHLREPRGPSFSPQKRQLPHWRIITQTIRNCGGNLVLKALTIWMFPQPGTRTVSQRSTRESAF